MATVSSARRPVKPIRGTARCLTSSPAVALAQGLPAGLLIRRADEPADSPGTAYMVSVYLDDGTVFGYRLEKLGGADDAYDIDADFQSCTCRDHVYRQRCCKHLLGLRAALKSVGLI
jgi:hypothetical protein